MNDELQDFIKKVDQFKKLKASEQIDFFAYFFDEVEKKQNFTVKDISSAFEELKLAPLSYINRYLTNNSNKAKPRCPKIKFLKLPTGFHLESNYCLELQSKIVEVETPFINYSVNSDHFEWKPSDIPFGNSKIKSGAEFFSTIYYLLYHLENSLRKFLANRLLGILGQDWEKEVCAAIDVAKAQAIRHEVHLSEMLPKRGDTILFYCMWDDYGKFLKQYPNILGNVKETDEVLAHLNSLSKIRNAVAHNAATIPKEYQEELTLFIKKYIKIMQKHVSL